jgi:hypothetical protein
MTLHDPSAPTPGTVVAENLGDWRGQSVVDPDGEKVGSFDELFYDTETDAPAFIAVKSGVIGKHLTLVPVAGASVGPDYVRVAHSKAQIKDAPNHDTDVELSASDEATVYGYYQLPYAPAGQGARRLARR